MKETRLYIEKDRYDMLLRRFMCLKRENQNLKEAWNDLKSKTAQFDDRVLEDIHRFGSLEEENAYIVGSFNTMLAVKYDMEELEEKFNAADCK